MKFACGSSLSIQQQYFLRFARVFPFGWPDIPSIVFDIGELTPDRMFCFLVHHKSLERAIYWLWNCLFSWFKPILTRYCFRSSVITLFCAALSFPKFDVSA